MKILAIADKESAYYWDFFDKSKFEDIDLIISCGDLESSYLEFLATLTSLPILYIHGNHDTKYDRQPPGGCICIEDDIYVHEGIRIMGLGGSMRYNPSNHQYTDREMFKRVRKMWFKIFMRGGFDILVTHAPAFDLNDGQNLPHRGFKAFRQLLDRYKPKYFLHGHVHMSYGREHKRLDQYQETKIINAYERYIFEYEYEHSSKPAYMD